jgi:hypothetical protein
MCGTFGAFGAMPAAAAAGERKTRFYVLEQAFLKNGPQVERMNEFAGKHLLPALNKVHSGPKIYLQALVAPHMPQFAAIYGFESLEEMWRVHTRMGEDQELAKAAAQYESAAEAPAEHATSSLLEATDYSPEIAPSAADAAPRIFELRVYHSPTWRCEERMTVRPAARASRISVRTVPRTVGSRLEVGSSRINKGTSTVSTAASASFCRMPVDIWPVLRDRSRPRRSAIRTRSSSENSR